MLAPNVCICCAGLLALDTFIFGGCWPLTRLFGMGVQEAHRVPDGGEGREGGGPPGGAAGDAAQAHHRRQEGPRAHRLGRCCCRGGGGTVDGGKKTLVHAARLMLLLLRRHVTRAWTHLPDGLVRCPWAFPAVPKSRGAQGNGDCSCVERTSVCGPEAAWTVIEGSSCQYRLAGGSGTGTCHVVKERAHSQSSDKGKAGACRVVFNNCRYELTGGFCQHLIELMA
jgi:hypothetical protein